MLFSTVLVGNGFESEYANANLLVPNPDETAGNQTLVAVGTNVLV